MPLFADDAFWKVPNVYDVGGTIGLVLGLLSIWLAWWLAKRDVEQRINAGVERVSAEAKLELRRIARALVTDSLADTCRLLELAREASRNKVWTRAAELCQQCSDQTADILGRSPHPSETHADLLHVSAAVLLLLRAFRSQPKARAGELASEHTEQLDETIRRLRQTLGRMRSIASEAADG